MKFEEYKDPLGEVASDWFSSDWYDNESDFSRKNNGSVEEQGESSGNVHS